MYFAIYLLFTAGKDDIELYKILKNVTKMILVLFYLYMIFGVKICASKKSYKHYELKCIKKKNVTLLCFSIQKENGKKICL